LGGEGYKAAHKSGTFTRPLVGSLHRPQIRLAAARACGVVTSPANPARCRSRLRARSKPC